MQLTLSPEEANILIEQLTKRLEHIDDELVHTDKRELQRALASDLDSLRAITERIQSAAKAS
jgi:hypothetical protein